jgi:hypothetical protein
LVSFLNLFDRWNQSSPTLSSHHRRPNSHAQLALGVDLQAAGLAAYREIAWPHEEIAHRQFVFGALTLAGARVSVATASFEIEMGIGDQRFAEERLHGRSNAAS